LANAQGVQLPATPQPWATSVGSQVPLQSLKPGLQPVFTQAIAVQPYTAFGSPPQGEQLTSSQPCSGVPTATHLVPHSFVPLGQPPSLAIASSVVVVSLAASSPPRSPPFASKLVASAPRASPLASSPSTPNSRLTGLQANIANGARVRIQRRIVEGPRSRIRWAPGP
jgi:hypothetical protein